MRRRGDVGQGHGLAGQPFALLVEVVDVGQVEADVLRALAHDLRAREAALGPALDHPLAPEQLGYLTVELGVEPGDQPPGLARWATPWPSSGVSG